MSLRLVSSWKVVQEALEALANLELDAHRQVLVNVVIRRHELQEVVLTAQPGRLPLLLLRHQRLVEIVNVDLALRKLFKFVHARFVVLAELRHLYLNLTLVHLEGLEAAHGAGKTFAEDATLFHEISADVSDSLLHGLKSCGEVLLLFLVFGVQRI